MFVVFLIILNLPWVCFEYCYIFVLIPCKKYKLYSLTVIKIISIVQFHKSFSKLVPTMIINCVFTCYFYVKTYNIYILKLS